MHLLIVALLGTALPAVLIGANWGLYTSVSRFFRQFRYLIPRLLVGIAFSVLVTGFQTVFWETILYRLSPRTIFGELNPVGIAYELAWQAGRVYGIVLIMIVVYRAFQKDVDERDELVEREVDVFA